MKEKESTPVLCESPKGVGMVIPLVTSWPDSVVVMDVTHDDWKIKEEAKENPSGSVRTTKGRSR
ncbi:type IV secretory system conjugative DNA transfer family protein [Escherichia coli]